MLGQDLSPYVSAPQYGPQVASDTTSAPAEEGFDFGKFWGGVLDTAKTGAGIYKDVKGSGSSAPTVTPTGTGAAPVIVNTSAPSSQGGLSPTTMLMVGGAALVGLLVMTQGRGRKRRR